MKINKHIVDQTELAKDIITGLEKEGKLITAQIIKAKMLEPKSHSFFEFTDDFTHQLKSTGNIYRTVTIGTQVWMAENLKAITYNDGISIDRDYSYCWYNNDLNSNKATFGALYFWGPVSSGKVCPIGWHVPSVDEWGILSDFLGGNDVAGGKLKETGTVHWTSSDAVATNASGFTALPSGVYALNGYSGKSLFNTVDSSGYYWSSNSHLICYSYNYDLNLVTSTDMKRSYIDIEPKLKEHQSTYINKVPVIKEFL